MILSGLNILFQNSAETSELTHNWQQKRAKYSDQQISEMPLWIKNLKESHTIQEYYAVVDEISFSEMQKLAYDIKSHFYDSSPASEKESLCLIVIGVVGTGKSYLINAIINLLQGKCTVTATTGKAAYNIKGVTVHSWLKLSIGS